MSNNRYIITKSNYTLKEKHKEIKNGNFIYERDYMVTTNLGGYDSGAIPYGESNFKFVHNQNGNVTRSFNNGNWLIDDKGNTVWTLDNIPNKPKKKESEVNIKINQNSLRDFVYYGSCIELIKCSLENIVKYYPGELYITNEKFVYETTESGTTQTKALGQEAFSNPVVVYNPFGINLTDKTLASGIKQTKDYYDLRYFADSLHKYRLIHDDVAECFDDWEVRTKNKKCYENGELISNIILKHNTYNSLVINEYYYEGARILITDGIFTGYHIRPTEKVITDVFITKFTEFERFLLNRDTTPLYTINIDTPRETDYGIVVSRTMFTLPTAYGWNIDVDSPDYSKYINKLSEVALFYDEHYSNNLWENIVHESIKNMDAQTSNPSNDEYVDDYRLGISNIHGLMLAYARQFDDIKLYIENIKSSNTVTYDENNNIPDYFLTDILELSGWEIKNIITDLDETASVSDLFPGLNKEYTAENLNTIFMRNLKLNSKEIFSRKGNRHAIEMLLSLFGLSSYEFGRNYYNCLPETSKISSGGKRLSWESLSEEDKAKFYDYKFDEYVVVAKNDKDDVIDANDLLCTEEINQQIKGDEIISIVDGLHNESVELSNSLVGLPVRMVYVTTNFSGTTGETQTLKYIIPWFDKTVEYDGKTYFQMYGGWDKIETADPYYTETLKYLNIVDDIGKLKLILQKDLIEGEIYYVKNIGDYKKYYPSYPTESALTPSHYFYIGDITKSYQYKNYADSGSTGWEIIPELDVKNKIAHGIQVYQLENIINDYKGNNPHVGFGKYDSGDKYLKRLSHIFDGAFDDGLFNDCIYTCHGDEVSLDEIKEIGFELTDKLVDNVKCWYFVDNTIENNLLEIRKTYVTVEENIDNSTAVTTYDIFNGYEEVQYKDKIRVGKSAQKNGDIHNTSELETFNFETQKTDSNDEAAANSIINVKNVSIEFNKYKYNNDDFEKYLHDVIMFYLNQLIPTTSMLTVKYFRDDVFTTCYTTPVITGVTK